MVIALPSPQNKTTPNFLKKEISHVPQHDNFPPLNVNGFVDDPNWFQFRRNRSGQENLRPSGAEKKSGDQNQSTFPQTLGQEQSFQSFAETKDSCSKAKGFPANTVSAFENLALQN
jgi:hypothetical protein